MGISCQNMENAQIHKHFKMSPQMTGILITKINRLSSVYGILKKDDVLLSIDDVSIENDGTGNIIICITLLNLDSLVIFYSIFMFPYS